MRHTRTRQALAVLVVLCILVVGGLASAQSITHESHHAHHQKATHSTVLCSWMCAAGQTHDAAFGGFAHALGILAYLEPLNLVSNSEVIPSLPSARAPPQLVA